MATPGVLTSGQTEAVIHHARLDRSRDHFHRQVTHAVHRGREHDPGRGCQLCDQVLAVVDGALGEGYLACLADGRQGEDADSARQALTEIDRRR